MKKLRKNLGSMMATGAVLGVGASMAQDMGVNAGGFNAVANKMPMMGNIAGASAVIRATKKLKRK